MLAYLREIKASHGTMILIAEHNFQVIRAICNWVLVLNEGMIAAAGTADEILTDDILLKTFFAL